MATISVRMTVRFILIAQIFIALAYGYLIPKSFGSFMPSPSKLVREKSTESKIFLSPPSVDISTVGDDIEVIPMEGVTKIVMKFGGSSLATPERVTYVSK